MRAPRDVDVGRRHLSALFEREAGPIHGYVLTRSGSRAVAEDITGEVFVAAARRCAQGLHHEVTGAWLQTVAQRRLVDHWRRSTTRRKLEHRLRLETERIGVAPVDADGDDGRATEALDSLPDRQRAALCLRYLDEFSVTEVADAMDASYQGAESLLARARHSFANAYEVLA